MLKKCTLIIFFSSCVVLAFAQKDIKGITYYGQPGITKSDAEIRNYKLAHPEPANFIPVLKDEMKGPIPTVSNPNAPAKNKYGSLVTATTHPAITTSTAVTQTVWSNFLAIWGNYGTAISGRESPYTPPDNNGDVGFSQVIATANCRLKVFNKPSATGAAVTTTTGSGTTPLAAVLNLDLNVFFTNTALGISGISDPHVRFDRLSGRWYVVAIDISHTTNNYCCVAISDGSVITSAANFKIYYFNISQTGGSSTDFYDYPTLGVDKNYLYIGGNMFKNGRSFSGCNIWVVNKAKLITGSLVVTGFPHGVTQTNMYTPQGVHNDDTTVANGFFIGASQTVLSKLIIKKVIYGTTPTLSADLGLTTSTTASPSTVPTLGGIAVDGGDNRLYAAMIKRNTIANTSSLWVAQGTLLTKAGVGSSTGDRDGALWMEIGNLGGTPSILQSANLYDAINATTSAIFYTYPTIATNGQGHSLMGFTAAGPAKYAQASAAGRYRTDAVATFKAPVDYTNATSAYNAGANRWGDYTQTVVDPSDNMTMWTFNEYAPATSAWGVRAAQFLAPPPATPALAAVVACGTSTVTINGTSTNNSEFFDPGPGYQNRLQVTVTGGSPVSVTNIVFVNPTQITATFNTTGASSGSYTVNIINPDGQSASTTFSLTSNCRVAAHNNTLKGAAGLSDNNQFKNSLNKVYPNPSASIINYEVESNTNQKVVVEIYDMTGVKVAKQIQEVAKGINTKQISIGHLMNGTYYLQVTDAQNIMLGKLKIIKE